MGVDLLSWLYPSKATQGAVEKTPGILVLGAELVCPCGTSHSYLNLNTEYLDIADLPQANVSDRIAIDNILPFGSCRRYGSIGWPCKKIMDLAVKWENSEPQTMMVNGEEVITTDSTLICYVSGREIYAVTSGQEKENQFAEYKKVCEEIERDYPGLLAVLADPHGSVYLQDGMYELAIQFLEDYVKDAEEELLLAQIYGQKKPKDIFVVAALDRLLTDCDGSSFESLFNGLENTGCQTGMDQKEGWDIHKLNQQTIEMLKIDCKATAEKINTSSFARWTEEHKKFLNILGNAVLQLAYDVMIWHCTTASAATRAARGRVEYEITWNKNILATQEVIEGTNIPKSFVISGQSINGKEIWLHGNGTKHMGEFVQSANGSIIVENELMISFQEAVAQIPSEIQSGRHYFNINGWEIGINGETGVIFHALLR